MKVLLKSLEAGLRPLSSLTITVIALGWVLALGVADYCTPGPMSFVLFYMLAVVFAGWGAGKRQAWLISGAALVTMVTVQVGLHRAAAQPFWAACWNQSTRFLVFGITGWLTAELRSLTRDLEDRIERQTAQWKQEAEAHQGTAARLSESLERFEQVINNITEVFWLVDVPKTKMVYISPGYEHLWGRKCHELYRDPGSWLAAVHPEDRDTVSRRSFHEQAAGGYDAEYRIVRPDGATRWIRDRAFPVRNAQGEVFRIAGIADDITERKQARETLQMQAAILQNMMEAVVVTDQQGLIVEMNPAAERTWGYGRDEVLGKPASVFSALAGPEALAVMRGVLEALEATGTWRGTFSNRRKDGTIVTCEALISRLEIGGRVLMVAVEQDVTERLAVEEQLQLQARVLESMAEAVLMMDEKGTIMLTNPAADAMLGYEQGELPGKPLRAVLTYDSEAYRRGLEKSIAQVKLQGLAARGYQAQRKDGTVIEVETRSSPVVIGGQMFIVVVGQDITQRLEAERALARKEKLYRTLFELSPDGILLEDIQGNILDANQALCRSFGYAREAVVGHNVSRFVPPEHQAEVDAHLAALRTGQELRHEVWNVRKNGERCLIWLNERPLPLPDGHQGILVVARDVTETKRTELLKEAFLSLGAKLSAAKSPLEAARAIYASTDLLWNSDAGVLDFWLRDSNQIETVLAWDVVGGQRCEVELDPPVGPLTPRTLRIVDEGELILRQPGELPAADFIPFGDVGRPSASIMSVPMRAENQTVGVFSVQSYARNAFTPADLQTLQALADYCAGALGRLRAEAKLRESEQTYRALVETTGTGYLILDKESRVLDANAEYVRLSGHLTLQEIMGRSVAEWTAPQDQEKNAAAVEKCLKTGAVRNLELTYAGPNGSPTPIEINGTVVQTREGQAILSLCWDISTRKRAESAKEAFLSLGARLNVAKTPEEAARAIYATADSLWKWDSASLESYFPEADQLEEVLTCDVMDGQRREIPSSRLVRRPSARMRRILEQGAELILEEEPSPSAECVMFGDTSRPSASLMYVPLRREGRTVGVLSIQSYTPNAFTAEDLRTLQALADHCGGALERLSAEEARRQSEDLNRTILQTAMDGFQTLDFDADAQGAITEVNDAFCRMTGYSREELLRMRLTDLEAKESPEELAWHTEQILAGQGHLFETRHRRKDGKEINVEISACRLSGSSRRSFGFVRDITERKRAEAAREALLSLGSNLNAARSPVEAARAIYASADLLWKWDCATLDVYSPEAERAQAVLYYDTLDGQRREIPCTALPSSMSPRMRRIMEQGPEMILRNPSAEPGDDSRMIGDVTRASASLLCVPLRQEGRPVGVLSIQSYTPNAYTSEDLQTLQALADHCGGALERIGAEKALREAHDKLEQRVQERTAELQSANVALRESESRLRLALDASNAGTWSWDARSNQSDWDDRYHEHYGFETRTPRSFEAWISRVHEADRKRLLARIQALLKPGTGDAWNEEFRVLHPKKGERWMAGLGRVERDQAGRAIRLAGINLDITERKLVAQALREAHDTLEQRVHERTAELQAANAALRESEERYRSLVNNLNVGVYRNTPEPAGRFIQANPALARIHGYESVEEFEKASVVEFYQDPRERKKYLADLLREGMVRNYEVRMKKRDGTPIYGSVSASAHRDANGQVDWIDGVLEDITQRKKAEQSLAEALEFNRQVVSASTVGIGVYKASGRCVMVNEAMAQITGGTIEQLLQQDFRRLKSWRTDGLLAKATTALDTRQPQELEGQSRTTFGRELTVSARFSSFVNQGELHLLIMLTDQTTTARASDALRDSEERYRTLAESSPDAIFILNQQIEVEYVNSTAASLWQRAPVDLIGLRQPALFPPESARRHEEVVKKVFATGTPVCQDEPLAFPTGDQWIELRLAPLFDAEGSVASVMGVCRDITQRKRIEQQLTEALDLNQKMLAAATMGMAAYKSSGECIFANEALARSVGGSVSDVLQGNFRRLEDWQKSGLLRLAEQALSEGQARSAEVFAMTRFGKAVWLDCHAARFVSNGQPHLLLMALDISQRKLAERLQKALLDNIPDPAWLKDAEGRFLACNQAFAVFHGQPIEAILGKTIFDIAPREAGRMTREDKKVMQARRSLVGEARVRDARGNMRWLESIKSPLCNEQDEVIGTVGIARDITERKQAEHLLQAQRDLGTSLSLTSDMAATLKHVLEITMQVGGVDAGGAYVLNERTGGMDLMAHHGGSSAFVKAVSHWAPDSPQFRLVQRGKPVFTTYRDLPFPLADPQQGEGLRGTALVPLCHEGRAIGALGLSSHVTDEIPAQTGLALEALAAQAAGAIARIRAEADRHRLERQLLEITDREQARIGQDIHDGLCQQLVSLGFDANTLARELSSQRGAQAAKARRMADLADQAITETRQLARGLFPVRLESEGLPPALEELAKTTCDRFKIQCRFRSKGNVRVASSTVATHLYRIAQEAVVNAVKHSFARVISIDLTGGEDQLRLKVEDDGKGLRPKTSKGADGMGLHIMDYRARSIGGTLRVANRLRGGTQVYCCVPGPLR